MVVSVVGLSERDITRYARQILQPGFGEEAQRKLKSAKIVIAGAGGLGCPAAIYSSVAGIGTIVIIDKDKVELSNLNRQVLHYDEDIDDYKVHSAFRKLSKQNPDVAIIPLTAEITEETVDELIEGANVVVDGMDNFDTRFILNAGCVRKGIPFVLGCIWGLEGKLTTIIPGVTPCLSCIYPTKPVEKRPFPVFGATPATVACLQVIETIKLIAGFGVPLAGRMLIFDAEAMQFSSFSLSRDRDCKICGKI